MSTAAKILEKFRAKKPDEYKAQYAFNNSLRDGKIKKPDHCERCGKTTSQLEAHHASYDNPTKVTFLCTTCHALIPKSNAASKK